MGGEDVLQLPGDDHDDGDDCNGDHDDDDDDDGTEDVLQLPGPSQPLPHHGVPARR